jgi:hypothetical protein
MRTVSVSEQKISLAQTILGLNDINKIVQIQQYVNELLDKKQKVTTEFDAKTLSFSEWNTQFENSTNLDDYIPEYGMKLRDFRLKIYNSEREQGMSKQDFLQKIQNWK